MRHRHDHAAMPNLRILEDLGEVVDRASRHLRRLHRVEPVLARSRGDALGQQRDQRLAVPHALRIGRIARIASQFGHAEQFAELGELAVVADGDDQVAIAGLEDLVRHDVLVGIAHAARRLASGQVVRAEVGQHRHLRVQQRHVDDLALAGRVAMAQRGQDRDRRIHAGEQVRHRHADLLRSAAGQRIGFAGDAHQPAQALHRVVVTGAVPVGAGLAEAGDRAEHQPRIERQQCRRVQTVAGQVADLVVLDHHVRATGQFPDQVLALGTGDVDADRALVAVRAQVVGRLGGVLAVAILQVGRPPPSGVIAPRMAAFGWAFDLDDVGAEVGQGLRAPGPGQHAGEIQDAHALQGHRGGTGGVRFAHQGIVGDVARVPAREAPVASPPP